MSSILKALKKIEQDSPPFQVHQTLPNTMASWPDFKPDRGRRWRKMLYLFIILFIISAATVAVYSRRELIIAKMRSVVASDAATAGKMPPSNQTQVYRAKVPLQSSKPAPKPPKVNHRSKPATNKVVPRSRKTVSQAAKESGQERRASAPSLSPKTPVNRTSAGNPGAQQAKPRSNVRSSSPSSRPAPNPTTAGSTAAAAGTLQPARTRSSENYDRITDSNLKLQALVWSEEAVRRMAVINGSIVHEGESVDGYQVQEIRAEDVLVRKGGKSWRLEFGLQQ